MVKFKICFPVGFVRFYGARGELGSFQALPCAFST